MAIAIGMSAGICFRQRFLRCHGINKLETKMPCEICEENPAEKQGLCNKCQEDLANFIKEEKGCNCETGYFYCEKEE